MLVDARGLPLSTASAKAAAAFDHLVTGYLTYRADTLARLAALLEADIRLALERVAGRRGRGASFPQAEMRARLVVV